MADGVGRYAARVRRVGVDGRSIRLELLPDGRLSVEGEPAPLRVSPGGGGVYHVSDGSATRTAFVAGTGERRWVFVDGFTYEIDVGRQAPDAGRGRAGRREVLASPMPATVATVSVRVGDTVRRGDVLIVVEAMKMELPITAPRDGRIAAVHCVEGQQVEPRVDLVELAELEMPDDRDTPAERAP